LAQHLRSLAAHQGAVLALHSVGACNRAKRVVGIIVVEPIRHADLVKSEITIDKSLDFQSLSEATDERKAALPPATSLSAASVSHAVSFQRPAHTMLLGVAVMWVNSDHRRKGLAQHLISIACGQSSGMFFQFIGCTNKQVAFLAPTDDGARFASKLRGDGHLLQYNRYEDVSAFSERVQPDD